MNPVFEARSPRTGWHQARAHRDNRNAEHFDTTESLKALQVKRLRAAVGCTEATASTVAYLAFGEAKR
jgi:hypothetical protein